MAESCESEIVSSDARNYLREIAQNMSLKDIHIDVSSGAIRGDNYMGIIAKVVITGKDDREKRKILNFIVKSAPRSGFLRNMAPIKEFYKREIKFYSQFLPLIIQFQEEKRLAKPLECFAKFYGSILDEFNEVLVLENMKEMGYQLCDRRLPLNYDHVALILREYGKLHALSFALKDQRPDVYKNLAAEFEDLFFAKTFKMDDIEAALKLQRERALKPLDPVVDKVAYEKFKIFLENIIDKLPNIVSSEAAEEYAVIGHGDCWINNLLFNYEDPENPNTPTKTCIIDWQLSRNASPALDISYLICSSTDKKLRDEHYDDLLNEYYNSLSTTITDLGSDPKKLFPFETFKEHIKKFSIYGLHMAVMLLYLSTSEVDEIGDINSAASKEEVMESFFNNERKTIEKYNCRLKDLVLDCVNLEYI